MTKRIVLLGLIGAAPAGVVRWDLQARHGIRIRGIVGQKTWRTLGLVGSIVGVWSCGC